MKKVTFVLASFLLIAGIIQGSLGFQFFQPTVSAQESAFSGSEPERRSSESFDEDIKRLEDFDKLLGKAQLAGSVKVIVKLQADFTPEGELTLARGNDQRSEIRRVQKDLFDELNYAVEDVKQYDFIPYVALKVDAYTLERLKSSPLVASIQEDMLVTPTLAESTALIGAPGGVSDGFSGSGQTVAILDTGVEKSHVFFSGGKVVSEACYSTSDPSQGINSLCPGGVTSSTDVGSGVNCPSSVISCFHGTHVAGIAAGRDEAGNRFGVAKDANIISVQIYSSFTSPTNCSVNPCAVSFTSDIISGLQRVYELRNAYNISSVNMSLGGGLYTSYCDSSNGAAKAAIDNLRSVGIATIIASGNNYSTTSMTFPGCISSAISVGSVTDSNPGDQVSSFSNSSDFLNLLAPGQPITSSVPGNSFATYSGTSMAAPHVAGAWAILKQRKPTASVSEILTALASTGKLITDSRSGTNNRQTPRIRIDAALHQLAGTDCVRVPMTINQTVNGSLEAGTCSVEAGVSRNLYKFNSTVSSGVTITMSSGGFNTSLYLLDPNNKVIASDTHNGTGSRITASLSLAGDYTIIAARTGVSLRSLAPQDSNYVLNVGSPTAAPAAVSGRIFFPTGNVSNNALVTLTDSQGNSRTNLTGRDGRFSFNEVRAGETYILSVSAKRYTFASQIISVTGDISELNFYPDR